MTKNTKDAKPTSFRLSEDTLRRLEKLKLSLSRELGTDMTTTAVVEMAVAKLSEAKELP